MSANKSTQTIIFPYNQYYQLIYKKLTRILFKIKTKATVFLFLDMKTVKNSSLKFMKMPNASHGNFGNFFLTQTPVNDLY